MIAELEGKIRSLKTNSVVVMIGGVGYQVQVTTYAIGKLAGLDEAHFYIHTHVREDALLLYGF